MRRKSGDSVVLDKAISTIGSSGQSYPSNCYIVDGNNIYQNGESLLVLQADCVYRQKGRRLNITFDKSSAPKMIDFLIAHISLQEKIDILKTLADNIGETATKNTEQASGVH